jgi:hypothetical protein
MLDVHRSAAIVGTLVWAAPEENGPTMPYDGDAITSFAYVGDARRQESALAVSGLVPGAGECRVEARWVDTYPELDVGPGDVITLVASQRRIATIAVDAVRPGE